MRKFPRISVTTATERRDVVVHARDGLEFMTFPGGEPHVKVPGAGMIPPKVSVDARLTSFEDVGHLLCLVDLLRQLGHELDDLFVPYFPGSRQDRGAPLTASIYADIFNGMGFRTISTIDAHSHVCTAHTRANALQLRPLELAGIYDIFVAPDAGAQHRTDELAARYGVRVLQGMKSRDPKTGELTGFQFHATPADWHNRNPPRILIPDDICDGGGTFIGLAEAITEVFPTAILDLYVTHGIFSKGTDALFEQFRRIYSSTSFLSAQELTDLKVIPIQLNKNEAI